MSATLAPAHAVPHLTSVLIAHRAPLVAEGLTHVVNGAASLRLAGTAHTINAALAVAAVEGPQIVVCGLRFADGLAPELCRRLKSLDPACTILIFSDLERGSLVQACLSAGAFGILHTDASKHCLMNALADARRVAESAGNHSLNAALVPFNVGTPIAADELTPREYEVLRLTATGMTCKAGARHLHLAPNTVRSYCQSVLIKLGARNKLQAVDLARRTGLI
jgi:two-component system response regulator DesR